MTRIRNYNQVTCGGCGRLKTCRAKGLCGTCYNRQAREKNPELKDRAIARNKAWRKANPEKQKALNKRWNNTYRTKHLEGERRRGLRYRLKKYGLTEAAYKSMSKSCEICGSKTRLSIDHDHVTGKVRGILCRYHNTAIGLFKDNIEHIKAAIAYLERRDDD